MDAILVFNSGSVTRVIITDGSAYAGAKALVAILNQHGRTHYINPDDAEDTDTYTYWVLKHAENVMGEPWRLEWIEDVTTIMT
jgi:hypothetical protein